MSSRDVAKNGNWKPRDVVCAECATTAAYNVIVQGKCPKCGRATCIGCRPGASENPEALCRRCDERPGFANQPWVTFVYEADVHDFEKALRARGRR